jgi:hypothetical protein
MLYIGAKDPGGADKWLALAFAAGLALNFVFLLGLNTPAMQSWQSWRVVRLWRLWLDAKEADLRKRAGHDVP